MRLLDRIVPSEELDRPALELAIALKHPVNDCYYLALAEREKAPLVTADQKLLRTAQRLQGVDIRAL